MLAQPSKLISLSAFRTAGQLMLSVFVQMDPLVLFRRFTQLIPLEVQPDNQIAENRNPILDRRLAGTSRVAHVEISLHIRVIER